jgi:rubrerythrin
MKPNNWADRTKNPEARSLFLGLMDEEVDHRKRFESLANVLDPSAQEMRRKQFRERTIRLDHFDNQ